jgi:hypothetical protein
MFLLLHIVVMPSQSLDLNGFSSELVAHVLCKISHAELSKEKHNLSLKPAVIGIVGFGDGGLGEGGLGFGGESLPL